MHTNTYTNSLRANTKKNKRLLVFLKIDRLMNTCMQLLHLLKAAVFSDRYSHFGYEPHLGGNKFYDVEGFPAIILPEENPLYRGNTAMQNYV